MYEEGHAMYNQVTQADIVFGNIVRKRATGFKISYHTRF